MRAAVASATAAGAIASILALAGCETEKSYADKQWAEAHAARPDPVLVVRHHIGGTHHRTIVHGDYWYATYSNSLLVISSKTGTVLHSVELMPFGACGGITELLDVGDGSRLYALLDGTAVCEISLDDPKHPRIAAMRRRQEIGFPPRAISLAGGDVWISGDGGVVAWGEVPDVTSVQIDAKGRSRTTVKPVAAGQLPTARLADVARERGALGPVVESAHGLVTTSGRRILRLEDGAFVGAATRLDALDVHTAGRLGVPGGSLFILQGSEGAQVGILNAELREVASRAVHGVARRVRVFGDELVAVNDEDMIFFPIVRQGDGMTLGDPMYARVRGALDLGQISENYFVVVGSFGRAFWRRAEDGNGPGDEFYSARREPADLRLASTDRRRVLAGGPCGVWLYTVGDEVSLVNRPIEGNDGRKPTVSAGWGKAAISDDKRSVRVVQTGVAPGNELVWRSPLGGEIFGVESLDGRLWIWHQDGIDVMTVLTGAFKPDAAVRIEGPVHYLFPQRVGGAAAYVSEAGGFGLLDFIERAALPTTPGERIVDRNGDGTDDVVLTDAEIAGALRGMETKTSDVQVPTAKPSGG